MEKTLVRQRVYKREKEKRADITKSGKQEKQRKKLVLLAEEDRFQKILRNQKETNETRGRRREQGKSRTKNQLGREKKQ